MARLSTFAALRHRDFRLLWLGLTISGIGSSMQSFGLGWLVVQLAVQEGTPELAAFYLGLVGLSRGAPAVVVSLYGGVLADRVNRRKLLVLTRFGAALIAAVLAALTISGLTTLWILMVFSALAAFDSSLDNPTRHAITPQLVPSSDLMSAVGLNQGAMNIAALIGPLLGGLLIIPYGVGGLMVANATGYVGAVILLFLMRPLPDAAPSGHANPLSALGEGLVFIRREPALRMVVGLSVIAAVVVRPVNTMMPAIAYESLRLGAVELSWLLAAGGLGALMGSMLTASLRPSHPARALAISTVVWGLAVILFAAQTELPAAMLLAAIMHGGQVTFAGIGFVALQTRSPDGLRGRVISIFNTTAGGGGFASLGQVAVGALAGTFSLALTIGTGGLALTALGVVALLRWSGRWSEPAPAGQTTT